MAISLKESNEEHWILACRFALDIRVGTTKSVVEYNSTLDEYVKIPL